MRFLHTLLVCSLSAFPLGGRPLHAAETFWKAGVARANITPTQALWLAGYGGRDKPADGKLMDLWIKVLALEDASGHRALILTSDTLGIPQTIYQHTCAALKDKFAPRPGPDPPFGLTHSLRARCCAARSMTFIH